jgi:uncharacterized protein YkwD
VERIRRGTLRTAALLLAAAPVALLLVPAGARAQAGPTIELLGLSGPAVVGKDVDLKVEAIDKTAPVSGLVVNFGGKGETFGISACRPPDSTGALPGGPFAPGARSRMTAPHRYRKKGKRKVLVRLEAGGCLLPLQVALAQFTVHPSKDGKGPQPSKPKLVPSLPANMLPLPTPPLIVPGGTPALLPIAAVFARYERTAYTARHRRGCAGAHRRSGGSARARRAIRKALLCLLNQQRRRYHLPRLRANHRLLRAAEAHSRSMIRLGYFSHDEPGGVGMLVRILRSGYLSQTRGWSVGENLGMGRGPGATPGAMVRAWMASTPHRANILAGKFREIGLGVLPGIPGSRGGGLTYTTDFGRRR